jgi:hypothetical protein
MGKKTRCAERCSVQASQRSARKSCKTYLNGAEVDEEVGRSVLGGDETVSLLVVEPLDSAVLAVRCRGVHFDDVCVGGGFGGSWYIGGG